MIGLRYFTILLIGISCLLLTSCDKENIDSLVINEDTIIVDSIFCNMELLLVQDSIKISAVVSGGETPYSYLWSTGETTSSLYWDEIIQSDTYNVIVTDAQGCTALANFDYEVPDTLCFLEVNIEQIVDSLQGDTQLQVINNGTPPFTYLWSTGETTSYINIPSSTGEILSILVTDANGCVGEASFENESCGDIALSVELVYGTNNTPAYLQANVDGGQAPFSYLWSSGQTTDTVNLPGFVDTLYTVIVTDVDGCTAEGVY